MKKLKFYFYKLGNYENAKKLNISLINIFETHSNYNKATFFWCLFHCPVHFSNVCMFMHHTLEFHTFGDYLLN